jgi:putative hydrolase of the HAD superfamily
VGSIPAEGTRKRFMKNIIIFDADEVVIKREIYFSQRLARDFGISEEDIMQFFRNEFKDCAVGKADLKEELGKYTKTWGWESSIDDLLKYWFESERELDEEMVNEIKSLRAKGYICCLATNNEAYRTKYLAETVGLKNLFDYIFSSSEIGHLKSEDNFWKYIWDKLGVKDKENIVVWESDGKIVEKITELGMRGIFFNNAKDFRKKMEEILGGNKFL